MIRIAFSYLGMVLFKWTWESVFWMERQRNGDGMRGLLARWWAAHRLDLIGKAALHFPLFGLWISGILTPYLNAGVQWLHRRTMDEGIATVPPELISDVTWLTTMPAAFMLDTFGKPVAVRLTELARALTLQRREAP